MATKKQKRAKCFRNRCDRSEFGRDKTAERFKKQELLGGVKLWEGFVRVMLMKIKSLNRRVQESVLFADETSPCEDS